MAHLTKYNKFFEIKKQFGLFFTKTKFWIFTVSTISVIFVFSAIFPIFRKFRFSENFSYWELFVFTATFSFFVFWQVFLARKFKCGSFKFSSPLAAIFKVTWKLKLTSPYCKKVDLKAFWLQSWDAMHYCKKKVSE